MAWNEKARDRGHEWEELLDLWHRMEWPEGSKVEIVEGVVTVAPIPASS
jgi:hypothetical protein